MPIHGAMTHLPRSIFLDLDVVRGSKPRPSGQEPVALRLVPPPTPRAETEVRTARAVPVVEVAKAAPVAMPLAVEVEVEIEPAPALAPTSAPAPAPAPIAEIDRRLLAVLDETAAVGESADALFRRKEHALGTLFAALPVPAALALHKRLTMPAVGDPLHARFSRLVAERRARLLAFLADAPRREAVDKARRPQPMATPTIAKGAVS